MLGLKKRQKQAPKRKYQKPLKPSTLLSAAENEARVQSIIREAQDDWHDNLLETYYIFDNRAAVHRHYRRYSAVIGAASAMGAMLKMIGLFVGVGTVLAVGLWYDNQLPVYFDWGGILAYSGFIWIIVSVWSKYQAAFISTYCVERADFTDPSQVTGLSTIKLPRLVFYDRPDVWRGNNGQNGFQSSNAYCVVQTGRDNVFWDEQLVGNWDLDIWCDVRDGKRITSLRDPHDYYWMDADPYMATCTSMKELRAWCRLLQRNGALMGRIERGALSVLEGKWPYLVGAIAFIIGFMMFGMSMPT